MSWNDFRTTIGNFADRDLERVRTAFDLGQKMHEGQTRKSGEAFFLHPIAVAEILASWGGDADTIIAALLHDTIEDTTLTLKDAEKQFGKAVARLIEGVTKLTTEELERKPTLDEQTETLRKMFKLLEKDVRIVIIKLADRLHNMQTIQFLSPARQQAIAQETVDIFVKIAEKLSMHDLQQQLQELSLPIVEPELFKQWKTLRTNNSAKGKRVAAEMLERISSIAKKADLPDILHEDKNWDKLREQRENEGSAVTGIAQLIITMVCKDVAGCYHSLGLLHQLWKRESGSFQDYINSPMPNGYRGLHTTIILENGTRIRCKIRTEDMQDYAHRGITLLCFDGKAQGITHYVPWARNIGPLVEDTKGHSQEFWEGLQSDILGQFILIHGPGDRALQVPQGATALDGVFYLFGGRGVHIDAIQVNGEYVPFHATLSHGDSVSATFVRQFKIDRAWLNWVHTGLGTAYIRSALSLSSEQERHAQGKRMLQQFIWQYRKGYIEEFNEGLLAENIARTGYDSLGDVYIAIAEGHLDAQEAYYKLFESAEPKTEKRVATTIRFGIDMDDRDFVEKITAIQKSHAAQIDKVQFIRVNIAQPVDTCIMHVRMGPKELQELFALLRKAGAQDPRMDAPLVQTGLLIAMLTLCLLWGLDPVFAKWLINSGMHPLLFTFIRSWTLMLFSLFLLLRASRDSGLSRIPLRLPSLWIAGVCFFLVSVATYLALAEITPAAYNTLMRANALLLSTAALMRMRKWTRLSTAWLLTIAGFILLANATTSVVGLSLSIIALGLFAIYTYASRLFQQTAKIHARYHQFFFYLSAIAAACSLFLLPFLRGPLPPLHLIASTILFSIAFVGVPYVLFYFLTSRIHYSQITRVVNASIYITILGQALLFGMEAIPVIALAATLFVSGNFLVSRQEETEKLE